MGNTVKELINVLSTLTEAEQNLPFSVSAPSIFGSIASWGQDTIQIFIEDGIVTIDAVKLNPKVEDIRIIRRTNESR